MGCLGGITQNYIYRKALLMLHIPVPAYIAQSINLVWNESFHSNQSLSTENKSLATYLLVLL